jgi:SpoVK/Ycf46/Vps4 family AAA+-type ATPase
MSVPAPSIAAAGESKKARAGSALALLPKLIEAFQWGQQGRVSTICQELASVLAESHPAIAKRLQTFTTLKPTALVSKPDKLVDLKDPRHGLADVTLPAEVADQCRQIVVEQHRRAALAAYHLEPRHKVLLHGAPGNGKTMLAEALAHELGVPFLCVKYGGLIASHLGETGRNLDALIAYAKTAPCVLFIDEFDGIGMNRATTADVGELRRVTNHLLIAIEDLPSSVVLVCATNAVDLIDPALARRFDFTVELPAPTDELKLLCARRELATNLTPGWDVSDRAEDVARLPLKNLFEVVEHCRQIRRDIVLAIAATDEFLSGGGAV